MSVLYFLGDDEKAVGYISSWEGWREATGRVSNLKQLRSNVIRK